MEAGDRILTVFTTRMRQLILQYKEKVKETETLRNELNDKAEEIERLRGTVARMQSEYDNLKMAKMLEITDSDLETARSRVAKLIRDINKCITYLNGK